MVALPSRFMLTPKLSSLLSPLMFSRVGSEKEKSGEGDVQEAAIAGEEVAGVTVSVTVGVVTAGAVADEGSGPVSFGVVSFAEAFSRSKALNISARRWFLLCLLGESFFLFLC